MIVIMKTMVGKIWTIKLQRFFMLLEYLLHSLPSRFVNFPLLSLVRNLKLTLSIKLDVLSCKSLLIEVIIDACKDSVINTKNDFVVKIRIIKINIFSIDIEIFKKRKILDRESVIWFFWAFSSINISKIGITIEKPIISSIAEQSVKKNNPGKTIPIRLKEIEKKLIKELFCNL